MDLMRRCWPLFGLLLVSTDALARSRTRSSGWSGLVVFAFLVVVAILSKVLPESIKSHPLTIPLGVGIVLGALFSPMLAQIAVATNMAPSGNEPLIMGVVYVVILLGAAAYGLLLRVSTSDPDGIESTGGECVFEVEASQVRP